MKVLAIVFAAIIAAGVAIPPNAATKFGLVPQVVNEVPEAAVAEDLSRNVVADLVTSVIQRLSQVLRDLGLDPLNVSDVNFALALPVPSLFGVEFNLERFSLRGISNIVINRLAYGLLTSRLTFDISLPQIVIEADDTDLAVRVLSNDMFLKYKGRIAIQDVGIAGTARISIGLISGVSIRELDINFYLGGLRADINELKILGQDLTSPVNDFVNVNVFRALKEHEEDISELIELIAWRIIEQIL